MTPFAFALTRGPEVNDNTVQQDPRRGFKRFVYRSTCNIRL